MVTFWGIFSDRFGRKLVFIIAFIIQGITLAVYPFVPNFWILLIIRILLSFGLSGANAIMTSALGDYIDRER